MFKVGNFYKTKLGNKVEIIHQEDELYIALIDNYLEAVYNKDGICQSVRGAFDYKDELSIVTNWVKPDRPSPSLFPSYYSKLSC